MHLGGSPQRTERVRSGGEVTGRGNPEVGQGGTLETCEENVRGFDVPVENVLPVHGLDRSGKLHRVFHGQCGGEYPVRHPGAKVSRGAFLHYEEGTAIGRQPGAVDGDDVGMP